MHRDVTRHASNISCVTNSTSRVHHTMMHSISRDMERTMMWHVTYSRSRAWRIPHLLCTTSWDTTMMHSISRDIEERMSPIPHLEMMKCTMLHSISLLNKTKRLNRKHFHHSRRLTCAYSEFFFFSEFSSRRSRVCAWRLTGKIRCNFRDTFSKPENMLAITWS